MFKIETIVKAVIFTFVASVGVASLAVDEAPRDRDRDRDRRDDQCEKYEAEYIQAKKELLNHSNKTPPPPTGDPTTARLEKVKTEWDIEVRKCNQRYGHGPSDDECRTARRDFDKAKVEAIDACRGFAQTGASGNIGCAHAVEKCQCGESPATSTTNPKSKSPANSEDNPLCEGSKASNKMSRSERFQRCPAEAAIDIDKKENEAKEQRRIVSEAQRKANEARKSAAAAGKAGRKEAQQLRERMLQEAEKQAETLKEAKRASEQAQNELKQQVLQYQEQITAIESRRLEVNNLRNGIDLTYQQRLSRISLQCHDNALKEVAAMRATEPANRGNFVQMTKNVNQSERDRWQKWAKEFHRRCMTSDISKKAKEEAAADREVAFKRQDRDELKIDQDRKDVETRIRQIRNGGACAMNDQTAANGDTAETGMCQARRKAVEDGITAAKVYRMKQQNLQREAAEAYADAKADSAAEGEALTQATGEYARENARLLEIEAELAEKKRFAGSARIDQKQFDDAKSKNSKLKLAALTYVDCQATKTATNPNPPGCSGDCQYAAEFLSSVGVINDQKLSQILNTGSRPATNGPVPSAEPAALRETAE